MNGSPTLPIGGIALVVCPLLCLALPPLVLGAAGWLSPPGGEAVTTVEILSFEGCPNHDGTRATVERVLAELGLDAEIREIDVPDDEAAKRHRFLGSPTVRVNGKDVEPGADERGDFTHACRIFRTDQGLSGQPDERWIRDAFEASTL